MCSQCEKIITNEFRFLFPFSSPEKQAVEWRWKLFACHHHGGMSHFFTVMSLHRETISDGSISPELGNMLFVYVALVQTREKYRRIDDCHVKHNKKAPESIKLNKFKLIGHHVNSCLNLKDWCCCCFCCDMNSNYTITIIWSSCYSKAFGRGRRFLGAAWNWGLIKKPVVSLWIDSVLEAIFHRCSID